MNYGQALRNQLNLLFSPNRRRRRGRLHTERFSAQFAGHLDSPHQPLLPQVEWLETRAMLAAATLASAPTNVIGTAGEAQVALSWTVPSNDGGSPITDYTIQYSSDGGSQWTTFPRTASSVTSAMVTGLAVGPLYTFRVAAVNTVGTGVFSSLTASVTPFSPVADFTYTITVSDVTITGYKGSGGQVVIPSLIEDTPVVGIGNGAFSQRTSLKTIAIPSSVTSIGDYAFQMCTGLTAIAISSSVKSIGRNAFYGCSSLTEITIPFGVTSIETGTFWDCKSLTSVSIPSSVTSIGHSAFYFCTSLATINIPSSVTSIGMIAFSYTSLTTVAIPSSVTSIGMGAFYGCKGLTAVAIPSSVTSIGDSTFAYCPSLVSINVDPGNQSYAIVQRLLLSKDGKSLVAFPGGLSGDVSVPSGVTNIAGWAFAGCASVTAVAIPSSVTSIGDSVFAYCTRLVSISVDPGNQSYAIVQRLLLSKDGKTVVACPGGLSGDVSIPFGVTNIASFAFYGNSSLAAVAVPSSVTSIAGNAFGWCTGLMKLYMLGNAPGIGDLSFYNVPGTIYYLPGTTGWSATLGGIPTAVATTPVAPTNVTGTPGSAQVSLRWTAPSNNGGSPITDYTIQYSSDAGNSWNTFPHASSTATTATVTALNNGTSYVFRVAAVNGAGTSSWSSTSLPVTPFSVPAVPTNVVVTPGNGQAFVSWTAPSSNGGGPITDYTIQYSSNSGTDWSAFPHSASTATTATVIGLTNGTSYVFRVAAANVAGTGGWSSNSSAATPRTVPAAPTNVRSTAGSGQASLSWTAPSNNGGSLITDYTIRYSSDAGSTWSTFPHTASTATTATVTGLANGTSYVFSVAAVNAAGAGTDSAETPRVTPLAATAGRPTVVAGNGYVDLRWTSPSLSGMPPITDYTVRYSTDNEVTWSLYAHAASPSTSLRILLANGNTYSFQVAPVVSGGTGGYSPTSLPVTPFSPTAKPVAPSGVVGRKAGNTVVLTWKSVPNSAGGTVSDYTVQYRGNAPNARWLTYRDFVSPATSVTIGLKSGYSYVFRVAAKNLAGVGVYSAQSTPVRV